MSNLPDDWPAGYRKCPDCGHRYHASGTESCACQCRECGEYVPVGELVGGMCARCKEDDKAAGRELDGVVHDAYPRP